MAANDHQHHHHHHHHGQTLPYGHGDDFTENNKAHWDDLASKYSEHQWQKDLLKQIDEFADAHMDWIGVKSSDRVLDYACGPGTVTHAIGSHASQYQGLDLSDNMVKAYNLRFASESRFSAKAVVGNLLTEAPPEHLSDPSFFNFDIAVIGMGFHHFEKLELCLQRLKDRLKPGGTLIIIDLLSHAPEERYKAIVAHSGFSEDQMRQLYTEAGLVDFDMVFMEKEVFIPGSTAKNIFMARGVKPAKSEL